MNSTFVISAAGGGVTVLMLFIAGTIVVNVPVADSLYVTLPSAATFAYHKQSFDPHIIVPFI